MANDYFSQVQAKKGIDPSLRQFDLRQNVSRLDKRMQEDVELLYLHPYFVEDSDDAPVKDVVNVTLNRPAVFAANVIASLNNAQQQIVVESDDNEFNREEVEAFLKAVMDSADRRLILKGQALLNQFADTQFAIRGRTARRIVTRMKDGVYIPDIQPWDGRYVYSEQGETGLLWGAYETRRFADEIVSEYGKEALDKVAGDGNLVDQKGNFECFVLDAWDEEQNKVWINGTLIMEPSHTYGYTPVVQQIVYLGYGRMLLDRDWHVHDGESIFFMIRQIVPELNRLASILHTLNMNEIKAALQFQNPQGSPQDEPPDPPELGDVISVGQGKLDPIRMGEARNAAQMMFNILEKAFQEGSFTDIDIGNVTQPFSAVALMAIGENRDTVFIPRLAAKELLNRATAEMVIRQALQMGGSIEIGVPGHRRSFPTENLKGEYDIQYKYFSKSPTTDAGLFSIAAAAGSDVSRKFKRENILNLQDPAAEEEQLLIEGAADLSPVIRMNRTIRALVDRDTEESLLEAEIMSAEMGVTLQAALAGETAQQPKPIPPDEPTQVIARPPSVETPEGAAA